MTPPRTTPSRETPKSNPTPPTPPATHSVDLVCPACGAAVEQVKCKVVCPRCRLIVLNCSEF